MSARILYTGLLQTIQTLPTLPLRMTYIAYVNVTLVTLMTIVILILFVSPINVIAVLCCCCDYAGMWYDYDCVECTGSRLIPEYIQLTDHCMEGNIMIASLRYSMQQLHAMICTIISTNTNCNTTNKINTHFTKL
jgi:hypothetical protein